MSRRRDTYNGIPVCKRMHLIEGANAANGPNEILICRWCRNEYQRLRSKGVKRQAPPEPAKAPSLDPRPEKEQKGPKVLDPVNRPPRGNGIVLPCGCCHWPCCNHNPKGKAPQG